MILAVTRSVATTTMKPNIYEPYAFDALQDYTFEFSYRGPQAHSNRLIVKDNATEEEVYNQQIHNMQLKHTLPAGSLQNGKVYKAIILVYDINGTASPSSDFVLFYCFTKPSLEIQNLSADETVTSSSHEVEFIYKQSEGEPLSSYQIVLYNSLGEIISQSGNYYPNNDDYNSIINGIALSYSLMSLDDDTKYFIQITGETNNHMVVDTGMVAFSVDYANPAVFAILNLENIEREGQIKIQSNIVSITGRSYPEPPEYIEDAEVDLRYEDNGGQHRVWFDEGFSLQKNFTLQMIIKDPQDYSTLMEFNAYPITLELKYMKGCFASQGGKEMSYVALRVFNQLTNYYLQSNYFELLQATSQYLHIWMRCVNDAYDLVVEPVMVTE